MECEIYQDNSILGYVFAGVFTLGIFLSYVPQQFTIIHRRSTEGINPYFLLLMNLGSSFAFFNIIILSKPIFSCCVSSISLFDCASSLMGFAQLFCGFFGPTTLMALSIKFREPGPMGEGMLRSAKILAFADIISVLLIVFTKSREANARLATYFGLAALCVGFVQYVPQMITTYRLKHTGSLSITMMLIQIPGGFIWAFSLMLRKSSHWSTWISVMASATFQLILLIMSLYFSCVKTSRIGNRIESAFQTEPNEQQPLLQPE